MGVIFVDFVVFKSLVNLYFDNRKSVNMYELFSSVTSNMLPNNVSEMSSVAFLSLAFHKRIISPSFSTIWICETLNTSATKATMSNICASLFTWLTVTNSRCLFRLTKTVLLSFNVLSSIKISFFSFTLNLYFCQKVLFRVKVW